MSPKIVSNASNSRLYKTLCKVLDALRAEAPASATIYHPPSGNQDQIIQARSRALLHLFLKARFGITTYKERESQITDGSLDGGVDAFHIDKVNKRIYLLQSKFRATAENFISSNMSTADLLKMDVSRIMKGETKSEVGQKYNNQILAMQKEIRKLPDVGSYVHEVVLLGNSENFSKGEIKKLVEGYAVHQFAHKRIYTELLFPVVNGSYFTSPNLTIEINLDNVKSGDSHLDYNVKTKELKTNIKLLFVPTREIGRILHTYKNSILKFNPRSFLELDKNLVNRDIENSIVKGSGNEFSMYNNGITLISVGTSISSNTATQGRAQVVVTEPQLVNGGQTAFTLGRLYEKALASGDFSVFKGKEVLLKIITLVNGKSTADEVASNKLIRNISKASNSQTKIDESDRRSNDQIQIDLQETFFSDYGMYYERKRGEFSDGIHNGYINLSDLVNRERLARVSLACGNQVNKAKAGVAQFFKEPAFSTLFSTTDVAKYAYGYEVLQLLEIEKRKGKKPDRWQEKKYGHALRYGEYAVVAASVRTGMKLSKSAGDTVVKILGQWKSFESWARGLPANAPYMSGSALNGVSYYKGGTVNGDINTYPFKV